jgi:hypothetical protein
MLYEIRATANGYDIKRMVQAENEEQALIKFHEDWIADGDKEPIGVEVVGRWSVE